MNGKMVLLLVIVGHEILGMRLAQKELVDLGTNKVDFVNQIDAELGFKLLNDAADGGGGVTFAEERLQGLCELVLRHRHSRRRRCSPSFSH